MLHADDPTLKPIGGIIEGDFDRSTDWRCEMGDFRFVAIGLGDPDRGPVVSLWRRRPGCEEARTPTHSHRCDTFRMAVGSSGQTFKEGGRLMEFGDFLFTPSNQVYFESYGSTGTDLLLLNADRRGFPHGFEKKVDPKDLLDGWPAVAEWVFGPEHVWQVHTRDEEAVRGMATSFARVPERPGLFGSVSDDASWTQLSDGSRIGVGLLADDVDGPAVLLSNNAPGAVESPAAPCGTDTFRMVLMGNVTIGDSELTAGQFRFSATGTVEGPVVHGPEGSTQVVIYADRRHWRPIPAGATADDEFLRIREVSGAMAAATDAALSRV